MTQAGKGLQQVGNAFLQTDLSGEEDFKGVGGRSLGRLEAVQPNAVGDDVNLFGGNAHVDEGLARYVGRNSDGVGQFVDRLFAAQDVIGGLRVGQGPTTMLCFKNRKLRALVGRAAVADELASQRLHLWTRRETCAGDGNQSVAGLDLAAQPSVETIGVPLVEEAVERVTVEAGAP